MTGKNLLVWVTMTAVAALVSGPPLGSGPLNDETIPLWTVAAGTPTVDGGIGEDEWPTALTGLLDLGTKQLAGRQPTVFLAFDEEALYVAARLPLPAGKKPKATETEHDGPVWNDDAVEVFVDPAHDHTNYRQFIANAAGTKWESQRQDGSWNAEWTCAARVGEEAWEVEMAIPFAALGVAAPEDGAVWGFNVAWDCQTPTPFIGTWGPCAAGLHDPAHFGHLRFERNGPQLRLTGWPDQTLPWRLEGRLTAGAASATLDAAYRRADGTNVSQAQCQAEGGGEGRFSLMARTATDEPGDYRLTMRLTGAEGVVLARLDRSVTVPEPIVLTLRPYFVEGTLAAEVDLAGLGRPPGEVRGRVEVMRPGDTEPAVGTMARFPESGKAGLTLKIAALPPGRYEVRAIALDEQGEELAMTTQTLEKPEKPPWLGSPAGVTEEVLPPWTPLEVELRGTKGNSEELRGEKGAKAIVVKPWGREYEFAGAFPDRIETAGRDVLAGPIRVVARVDGKEVVWTGSQVTGEEKRPGKVRLSASAESDHLQLKGQSLTEYDGMVRVDWELVSKGQVTLEELTFEIPFKAEHAKYLYHFPGRWGSAYNAGALPEEGFTAGFRPFLWLGDEDRGLAWFSESDRNWFNADENKVTEIVRDGDRVILRLHLVTQPVTLVPEAEQPTGFPVSQFPGFPVSHLTYTFGLQATPVKPVLEDVWDYRICHAGNYGIESQTVGGYATLEYPAEGHFNVNEGTLELWVKPSFDPNVPLEPDDPGRGRYNRDLFAVQLPNGDTIMWYWNIDDRGMRFFVRQDQTYPVLVGSREEWKTGEWHHLALTWGDAIRIYNDGELKAERPYRGTLPVDLKGAKLVFGGGLCEFALDEVRISDVARSPEEIAASASARGEREADGQTLLLDHLNGAAEGGALAGNYRFAPGKFGQGLQLYLEEHQRQTVLDRLAELGVRTICFHEHWTDIQNYTSTTHGEALRKLVQACHEKGMRLLLYFGYEMSNIAPEWPLYSDECLVFPRAGGYHRQPEQRAYIVCYRSHWQDFMAEGIARMMDEYDIDGVYLDGTEFPWGCRNIHHGCGYEKPDGSIGTTYPFFATRSMMRRIYAIVRSRKPHGLVNVHNSTCMTSMTLAWATSTWDGEQFGGIDRGVNVSELLPLEAFRCEFMGHQWGVPAEFLCYERPYTYREALSFTLLHDVLVRGSGLGPNLELESQLWRVSDEFGRKEAEWLPYWRNGDWVKVSPETAKVSFYRGKKGVLAVISNLGSEETDVTVTWPQESLGLPADRTARDALTQELLPLDGATLRLRLPSFGWRLVWIRKE